MIQLNESLLTGHAVVDSDHKQLIDALNDLETALRDGSGKESITTILDFLNQYTRDHFAREEAHMKLVGCPSLEQNCQQHALLVSRLDGWMASLEQGASMSLVLEIHREIANWISSHILKIDCKLRGCRTAP